MLGHMYHVLWVFAAVLHSHKFATNISAIQQYSEETFPEK